MAEATAAGRRLIERMFTLIDARQWGAFDEVFGEEIVYDRPGYLRLSGRHAVEHFYRSVRIIASGQHQLERVVCNAEDAACWGRFVGTGRDGRPIDIEFADAYRIHAGRIVARKSYFFVPGV